MRWTNQIFLKKIPLPFKIRKPVLACGAQAKNTLCFAKGNTAYISRIRPDLSIRDDLLGFEKDLHCLLKKKPGILACDLHPEYQSTKFAQRLSTAGYQLSAIQHHHAHIASCMAENGLEGQKIIGVAFDGTGWGDDGRLWGAEFLICDYKNFKRAAHLKEIPLLGLEMAIREPWRLAAAWLTLSGLNLPRALKNKDWRILKYMFKRGINSPAVSSMGRLFDAAAVLILKKIKASFEAELAIALEKNAAAFGVADTLTAGSNRAQNTGYDFEIKKKDGMYIIDPARIFKGILADLRKNRAGAVMAYRFHLAIAEMIRQACVILKKDFRINRVAFSGGVFQNNLLLRLALGLLYKEGFRVFRHRDLSCSDAGISLGQAVVASMRS